MSTADDIAQTLRALAVDEEDFYLANLLIETVQKVEAHGHARLRDQVQGVLGESHVTIQDRLDSILNIGRDTHQLTIAVQSEQIRQGAAIMEQGAVAVALQATFQQVAESVDHLAERDAQQYQESRADREQLNRRLGLAEQKLAALHARLDARPSPEKAQATYDGVQQMQSIQQQMQLDLRRVLEHLDLAEGESEHAAGDG